MQCRNKLNRSVGVSVGVINAQIHGGSTSEMVRIGQEDQREIVRNRAENLWFLYRLIICICSSSTISLTGNAGSTENRILGLPFLQATLPLFL